jgi:hypothetical protein
VRVFLIITIIVNSCESTILVATPLSKKRGSQKGIKRGHFYQKQNPMAISPLNFSEKSRVGINFKVPQHDLFSPQNKRKMLEINRV